jgi:hypothetical protein
MSVIRQRRWIRVGLAALLLAVGSLSVTGSFTLEETAAIGRGSSSGNTPPDCYSC